MAKAMQGELTTGERFAYRLLTQGQSIVRWFIPRDVAPDTVPYFRLQAIVACSFIVGGSGAPFIAVFQYLQYPLAALVVLWSFILFYCIPWYVRRGGSSFVAGHAFSAVYYQCHLVLCLIFGGVSAPNTMWFTGLPIVSVLIGGVRHGFFWGGIAATTIAGLYLVQITEIYTFTTSLTVEGHHFIHTTGMIGLLLSIFVCAIAYEGLKNSALERRRRIEQQLIHANHELQDIDAQKTAFFQNMSHELRTPLTLILGPLDEVRNRFPEEMNLTVAAKNARRLLRLVNQLLDFQKLRAGKRQIVPQPMELSRFISVCADYFHSACDSKGISFELVLHDSDSGEVKQDREEFPETWILGEADALEKITFNFLSNALKFTPVGGAIKLVLSYEHGHATISVVDTGPGISEAGQAKLFEVFTQVDGTTTREFEGSGLGLALARSLTEELGGTIGVDTVEGQGSTFWARFPICSPPTDSEVTTRTHAIRDWALAEREDTSLPVDDSGQIELDSDAPLVLVIDDLQDMRTLVSGILRRQKYRVMTAVDGEEGVRLALAHHPDLVITDWMMPKLSGPQVIAALADDAEMKTAPVILLTAKSDEESKLIGTEIGASAYLGKPFNEQELLSVVRNLIALKAREREVAALNRMLTETVLKRYLPPTLVERLVVGDIAMEVPQVKTVTVLFSDICDFTKLSDTLGPERVATLLNEYLSRMTEVVFEYQGTIDKFLGDGVMVMFGAPVDMDPAEQANLAVRCAAEMQQAMVEFAAACSDSALPELRMRIGVHQGSAVVGNFGSAHRSDYTCIGPMVNIASRIESACYPGDVLLSEAVFSHLHDFTAVDAGQFHLKGIAEPRRLYRVPAAGETAFAS